MNIEQQKSGKILLNGIDCTNLPIHERSNKFHLSYCPQYGGYFYDLTVDEIEVPNKEKTSKKNLTIAPGERFAISTKETMNLKRLN